MINIYKEVFVVAVGYKSGITRTFECFDFTIKRTGDNKVSAIDWEAANVSGPRPLWLNIDEIESAWVVRTDKKFRPHFSK